MSLDSVYRVSDISPLLVNISIYTGRLWDAFMFILCVYIHIYWYMNMLTQYMYTLYLHWSYTHLMGPSFAYSSWILFSDSISRLVLRFLLSEHVSLKLNTQQHQQLHQHHDWSAATGHEKQCCDNLKTEGLSWAYNDKVARSGDTHIIVTHEIPAQFTAKDTHSLAAKEEEVKPQPCEDQHDDGNGEAEDEPSTKVDHLCIWITAEETQRQRERD